MKNDIPNDLRNALEAFESSWLLKIINENRPEVYKALKAIIDNRNEYYDSYVQKALFALGRWKNPEIVSSINQILPDLNEIQRVTAVNALGNIGNQQALKVLVKYSNDSSAQVRSALIDALSNYKDSQAQRIILSISKNDTTEWVRNKARTKI